MRGMEGGEGQKEGQSNRGKEGQGAGHWDRMRKKGAASRTEW